MRYLLILLFLGISFFGNAQEVERNGKTYVVKKGKIMHNGNDVTATFSLEEQAVIKKEYSKLVNELKQKEKEEKRKKKLEKEKKKAENKQKKAEKELKRNEKLQSNYDKASKNYAQAQKSMTA